MIRIARDLDPSECTLHSVVGGLEGRAIGRSRDRTGYPDSGIT